MKIEELITVYLSNKINDLSQTKWNKLMFFIDGVYQSIDEKSECVTKFDYIKLPYGPVPHNYRRIINEMHCNQLIVTPGSMVDLMSSDVYIRPGPKCTIAEADSKLKKVKELNKILERIISIFGEWTAARLSNFSHELAVWKNAELYQEINLDLLKDDSGLENKYGYKNFGKLIMS